MNSATSAPGKDDLHDQDVLAGGLQHLLDLIGLSQEDAGASLSFTGREPIFKSRLRIASAMAMPIAAEALGIAALWRARTGKRQSIVVDLKAAGAAVNSTYYMRQSGYQVGYGFAIADPLTGFFRAGDGRWVRMLGSRPILRDRMLDLLGCSNSVPAIAKAIGQWEAQKLEDVSAEQGLVCTLIRTEDEWRAHPQGQALATQPVIRVRKMGESAPEPLGPGARPLSGVRVLELTHILAGPGATRSLAAQGAEVIRISAPLGGDPHYMIVDTGYGKKTAFLDLNTARDVARLKELIAGCDVFCNSQRPGSLEARGLGAEELQRVRPGLTGHRQFLSIAAGRRLGYFALSPHKRKIELTGPEISSGEYRHLPASFLTRRQPLFLDQCSSARSCDPPSRPSNSQNETISTQFEPLPVGYLPICFRSPLAGSIA